MNKDLLLAVDVGNTNTSIGIFKGKELTRSFRLKTDRGRTGDELAALLLPLFARHDIETCRVCGTIISSVVPPLRLELETMAKEFFDCSPMFVEPGLKTGIKVVTDNPHEVGADRIVNSVAAVERHGKPVVVVDFGTATTFDCVNEAAEYVGGIIAPGLEISSEALFLRAARLPRVEPTAPDRVIGRNTVHSIKSGLFHGYVGLVEGILRKTLEEMTGRPKVVATGWLGKPICLQIARIDSFDDDLTLRGLRLLFEMNR